MGTLLTRDEVAEKLRIPVQAVDNLRRRGLLPCVPLSERRIRFDADAIDRYIRTIGGETSPDSPTPGA